MVFRLSAKRKNGRFSVIPCFDGPDGSTKFRWKRSKIKGNYTSEVGTAKNGWTPKNDPLLGNKNFFGRLSQWESCSPRYTCDMPFWQKLWLPYKNWLFAPHIQIFGSKKHIFTSGSQLEPHRSMFSTQKKVSHWFPDVRVQKFYSLPPKLGTLAQKRPNLAQNWHFWPNIGFFGPFDLSLTKKQCEQIV